MNDLAGAFERNKLRNFQASSKLEGIDLIKDIDPAVLQIAGTQISQGLFVQHIEDRINSLVELGTGAGSIECVRTGVRLVLDTIDECNMLLLDEANEPINPPHETVDFSLVAYWDIHCADINS
ncbi:hypothetical protein MZD04_gp352 [Pseudomonas phage Psa21]|uniref:Uncharacterized protein n=1 Tax=Pseudomonas phage Psa21 TaxID=2530023 RepID=A0A481W580_9CAUD|nr:hypothetical protein MZD04_gp352 [Pseudomonas phage Psa21]QBJ02878.1 hypothetical protein PSA21_352 [Pseudomonas phage Psa21]